MTSLSYLSNLVRITAVVGAIITMTYIEMCMLLSVGEVFFVEIDSPYPFPFSDHGADVLRHPLPLRNLHPVATKTISHVYVETKNTLVTFELLNSEYSN